jgi:hypothetical protein
MEGWRVGMWHERYKIIRALAGWRGVGGVSSIRIMKKGLPALILPCAAGKTPFFSFTTSF